MTPERAAEYVVELWHRPMTRSRVEQSILAACREERRAALTEAASICHRNSELVSRDEICDLIDREPT